MRSEGVYGRLYSGGAVMTAVETDGDEVARLLEERYGSASPPTLPRERTSPQHATNMEELAAAISYRRVLDHLFGDLRTVHTGLASAEDEHQSKLMLLEELAHQRAGIHEKLQDRFFKVRHTLEALYSEQQKKGRWRRGFVLASVLGATPRNPRRFLEQVEQTEMFLRDPAVDPPPHDLNGLRVDFVELANDLKPLREELGAVLDAIDRVRKEAQAALVAKKEAIEEFDRIFGWVTRAFESYFHLAGLHDLAELIRPSVRRKGRLAAHEEAAKAEDPSAEDSAAEGRLAESPPAEESTPEAPATGSSTSTDSAPAPAVSPPSTS